jgi:hypothetical protein
MPDHTITVERDQLYEQVWTEPIQKLAKRYYLFYRGLGKLCPAQYQSRHVAYWARVANGQKPKRPPLPPLKPGQVRQFTPSDARLLREWLPVSPVRRACPLRLPLSVGQKTELSSPKHWRPATRSSNPQGATGKRKSAARSCTGRIRFRISMCAFLRARYRVRSASCGAAHRDRVTRSSCVRH